MKIGLSFSRCVRDIAEGDVDINDVLVIIARTDFDPRDDDQWKGIWDGYGGGRSSGGIWSNPEWSCFSEEDEERVRQIAIDLLITGKLHQPRQFGAHPSRLPYYWVETILPTGELDKNPAIKNAWNNFQVLAGLSNVKLENH